MCMNLLNLSLVVNPGSPFMPQGKTGFYMSRFLLLNGETTVLTLLKLVHLVLGGWLTVCLLL